MALLVTRPTPCPSQNQPKLSLLCPCASGGNTGKMRPGVSLSSSRTAEFPANLVQIQHLTISQKEGNQGSLRSLHFPMDFFLN